MMRGSGFRGRGGMRRGGGQGQGQSPQSQGPRPPRERSPVQLIRRNREDDGGNEVLGQGQFRNNAGGGPGQLRRKTPFMQSPRGGHNQNNNMNNNNNNQQQRPPSLLQMHRQLHQQRQRGNSRGLPGRSFTPRSPNNNNNSNNNNNNERPFIDRNPVEQQQQGFIPSFIRPSIFDSSYVQQQVGNNPFQQQQQQQQQKQSNQGPWILNPFDQSSSQNPNLISQSPFIILKNNSLNNANNNRPFGNFNNNNSDKAEMVVSPFNSPADRNVNINSNSIIKPLMDESLMLRNPFSDPKNKSSNDSSNMNFNMGNRPNQNNIRAKPPPPPKIGGISLRSNRVESSMEGGGDGRQDANQVLESYEARFLDLSATLGLETKSTPNISINDMGIKVYSYNVEFSRDKSWGIAEGLSFPTIERARENAYEIALKKAREIFVDTVTNPGSSSFDNNDGDNEHEQPRRQIFRGQKSWPNSKKTPPPDIEEVKIVKPHLLDHPQRDEMQNQESEKRMNSSSGDNNQMFEFRFKDYLDVLQMQCWLEEIPRNDGKIAFEVKVQSYDKTFQEIYTGEFCMKDWTAKESAFAEACKHLEQRFPQELSELLNARPDIVLSHQRAFLDLRSALGLEYHCSPEVKQDNGETLFAYNIEFSRPGMGGEPESVFGEFSNDRVKAKERSFEQALRRVQYLFGTELENVHNQGAQPMQKNREMWPEQSHNNDDPVNYFPPAKRMFSPQQSMLSPSMRKSQSLAFVPPLIKSNNPEPLLKINRENPTMIVSSQNSNNMDRNYEYRFDQQTKLIGLGYSLKKIPKFEGNHKIYAFEINAQGGGGNSYMKKTMGQYFRDEQQAKENCYKLALDELNSFFPPNSSGQFY